MPDLPDVVIATDAPAPAGPADVPSAAAPIPGGPWPASARFDERGLWVGGVSAVELASRFGTPLLVMDEDEVRDRMRSAARLFPRVAYAVKAFTSHRVIRIALEEDLDLLCASGGEVEACLRAGAPAARIQLHGNAKTDDELRLAVEARLGLVIVDGADELDLLDVVAREGGAVQPIALRVIPEVHVRTHEAIATGHAESKFGTPLAEAPAVARHAMVLSGVRLDGFQAHAGSQVLEEEPYLRVLEALARVAVEAGVAPRLLDVGGGFGVAYTHERMPDLARLASALGTRLGELTAADGWPERPTLQVEPGRALVANAGCTLYTVLARKRAGGRTLIAVDGGMSDNLRPMLYGAAHAVRSAGATTGPSETVTVVGRHCESGDVLAPSVELPAGLRRGDLLAVAATGAYAYPLASVYNRFGRPAVVGVRDGRADLWLREEDAADMDRLEIAVARGIEAEPPAGIEIRAAEPRDAASFSAFWRAVVAEGGSVRSEDVRESPGDYRRRFRRSWTDEEAQVVALDGTQVVGHVGVTREHHPVTRHVATLGIAVAASHRGRGIGAALLAEAFRWARDVGVEKLLLSVYPHNTAAISLYRRAGFIEEGRLSRHSRKSYGDEDEILMAAWVGPAKGPAELEGQGE